MPDIIINFKADTTGIDSTVSALLKAEKISDDTAKSFQKDEAQKQSASKKTAETFDFTNQELQNLTGRYTKTGQAANKLVDAFKSVKGSILTQGFKELDNQQIKYLKSLQETVKASEAAAASQVSLRTQIKQNTQALAELEIAGKRDTKQYQDLLLVTGELKDAMNDTQQAIKNAGSDTKNIEGAIGVFQGAASVFTAAQGAASLFGIESEQLQRQLVRLNALMSILQGVQGAQNLIQKESAAVMFIGNIQLRLRNYLTAQNTVEEVENTVATGANAAANVAVTEAVVAQTVAQRILNAVLAANPVLLTVTAFLALAAALQGVFLYLDKTIVSVSDLDKAFENINKSIREYSANITTAAAEQNAQIDLTIERFQKEGRALEDIQQLQNQQNRNRQEAAEKAYQLNKRDIEQLAGLKARLQEINLEIGSYNDKLRKGTISNDDIKNLDRLKSLAGIYTDRISQAQGVVKEQQEATVAALEFEDKLIRKFYSDRVALAQAAAEREGKITNERETNEIAAIQNTTKIALLDSANSEAQRVKIAADAEIQIAQLRVKYSQARIADQRKAIDAEMQVVTEGSQQQLSLRLKDLEKQRQSDLAAYQLTANEKLDIEAKFQKQKNDIIADYNLKAQLSELAFQKTSIQVQMNAQKDSIQKGFEDKKGLIDIEYKEEEDKLIASLQKREISEAQYNERLINLQKDRINKQEQNQVDLDTKIIAQQQSEVDNTAKHEKARLDLIKNSSFANLFQKHAASQEEFKIDADRIDESQKLNQEAYDKGTESYQEYLDKKADLDDEYNANKQAKDEEQFAFAQQIAQQALEFAKVGIDAALQYADQARQQDFQRETQALERMKSAQLTQQNLSGVQKAAIDNKFAKQEADLKRRQFEADKQADLEKALINGALAITNVLATTPIVTWPVGIALAAAATAAQVVVIEAAKPPAFATGVINFQGKGTGTSDENLVRISHGESIIKADATQRYGDILEQINNGSFKMPDVSMRDISTTYVTEKGDVIDYEQFGKVVAREMREYPQMVTNWDKKGITTHIISKFGNSEVLNNRVSSR